MCKLSILFASALAAGTCLGGACGSLAAVIGIDGLLPGHGGSRHVLQQLPTFDVKGNDGDVRITEFMAENDTALQDAEKKSPDWIELFNASDTAIDMSSYTLSNDASKPDRWAFPGGTLKPKSYAVVFASGENKIGLGGELHTSFKLDKDGGALILAKDKSVVVSIEYPLQAPDVSAGVAGDQFTYLAKPTPGSANAPASPPPPIFHKVTKTTKDPVPVGQDIPVEASLQLVTSPLKVVAVTYRFDYGPETDLAMKRSVNGTYVATIPTAGGKAGGMVRWYFRALDDSKEVGRSPQFHNPNGPQYHGTVLQDPSVDTQLPVLHMFTAQPAQAITRVPGARCSLWFKGEFYDNVYTRRRGITAGTWPKHKIKFDFDGAVFKFKDHDPRVEEINMQSFYHEPGQNSYMREVIGATVMRDSGVPTFDTEYIHVMRNAQFYGLFAFDEEVDDHFLAQWHLPTGSQGGILFKSSFGDLANLRWDIATDNLAYVYKKSNRKWYNDWSALKAFTTGINGGGPGTRTHYVLDNVDLPEVMNMMATETLLLNQDRCAKNFYTYYHPLKDQWLVLPWDLESSLGMSAGLGGVPAPDYCIEVCEQWTSPLYCDSDHPQDIPLNGANSVTVNAVVNASMNPGYDGVTTPDVKGFSSNRRSLAAVESSATSTNRHSAERSAILRQHGYMTANGVDLGSIEDPDVNLTKHASVVGPDGSYNCLYDAILDIPETREMYLRRLRTLVDEWLDGKLAQLIKYYYNKIRADAMQDNAVWGIGNIDSGYQQLVDTWIPLRKQQLTVQYAVGGPYNLVPNSQPPSNTLNITIGVVGDAPGMEQYFELCNPNSFAVDVTGWSVQGSVTWPANPGAVIPSSRCVYVARHIPAFKARQSSPKGGEGLVIIGPFNGELDQGNWTLVLRDEHQRTVHQKSVGDSATPGVSRTG